MCGIIGVSVVADKKFGKVVKNVNNIFKNQEHRGIKGAGFSRVREKKDFFVKKFTSPKDMFKYFKENELIHKGDALLFHHRIPTCTPNKEEYNHPLVSDDGLVSVIHNGWVSNSKELFDEYKDKIKTIEDKEKKVFTDSELIRIIIDDVVRTSKTPYNQKIVKKAIYELSKKLKGSFAIAFTINGDDKIWLFKNDKPLYTYKDNNNNTYFSSEYPKGYGAFKLNTVKELIDGEFGVITKKGYTTKFVLSKEETENMIPTYTYYSTKNNTCNYTTSQYKNLSSGYRSNIVRMLPIEEDLEMEITDDYPLYLDSLSNRNRRRYSFEFEEATKNLNSYGKLLFEDIENGKHPLIIRAIGKNLSDLNKLYKKKKIDEETYSFLATSFKQNIYKAFNRLTMENFNLLKMTNLFKIKVNAYENTLMYFDEMNEAVMDYSAFMDTVNGEIDWQLSEFENVKTLLEDKYFKPRTRQLKLGERKAINKGIQLLFNNKHFNKKDKKKNEKEAEQKFIELNNEETINQEYKKQLEKQIGRTGGI